MRMMRLLRMLRVFRLMRLKFVRQLMFFMTSFGKAATALLGGVGVFLTFAYVRFDLLLACNISAVASVMFCISSSAPPLWVSFSSVIG